jgi:two-component system cell cycle sensor histidine kinase/response regulator CckA
MVRGSGTVLIVDDEEPIREMLKSALSMLGYEVVTAADGEQGLKVFSEKASEIDLVLLDVNMPGMGGPELLREMKGRRPEVKVIIITGYAKGSTTQAMLESGATGLLVKPFALKMLSYRVAEIIGGPAEG